MVTRRTSSAFFWSAFERFGAQGIAVLFMLVLARLLDPADFGAIAAASMLVLIVTQAAKLGVEAALIQHRTLPPGGVSTVLWLCVPLGVLLTVLLLLCAPFVAMAFGAPRIELYLIAMSPIVPVSAFEGLLTAILRREMRFRVIALRSLVGQLGGGAVGVALAMSGYGAWALVAQSLVFAGLTCVLVTWVARGHLSLRFRPDLARDLLRFGFPNLGADLLTIYNQESPRLFVGLLLGVEMLGIFSLAYRIVMLATNLVGVTISRVALPLLSRIVREGGRVDETYLRVVSLAGLAAIPAFFLIAMLSGPFVTFVLGSQWLDARPLIVILCFLGALLVLNFINGSCLNALGLPKIRFQFSLIRASVGTVMLALATPFGLYASVGASVARSAIVEPMQCDALLRRIGVGWSDYFKSLAAPVFGLLPMVGVTLWYEMSLGGLGSPLALVALPPLTLAMYGIAVLAVSPRWRGDLLALSKQWR